MYSICSWIGVWPDFYSSIHKTNSTCIWLYKSETLVSSHTVKKHSRWSYVTFEMAPNTGTSLKLENVGISSKTGWLTIAIRCILEIYSGHFCTSDIVDFTSITIIYLSLKKERSVSGGMFRLIDKIKKPRRLKWYAWVLTYTAGVSG